MIEIMEHPAFWPAFIGTFLAGLLVVVTVAVFHRVRMWLMQFSRKIVVKLQSEAVLPIYHRARKKAWNLYYRMSSRTLDHYNQKMFQILLDHHYDANNQSNFSNLTLDCKDNEKAQAMLLAAKNQGAGRLQEIEYCISYIFPEHFPIDRWACMRHGDQCSRCKEKSDGTSEYRCTPLRSNPWFMMWRLEGESLVRVPDSCRNREMLRLAESGPRANSIQEAIEKLVPDLIEPEQRD